MPLSEVSALQVGSLTLAGGALRDVYGGSVAADGTAVERVIAYSGSPESACSFSGLVARNSVCWASGADAAAVTVSGSSELRNVTALAMPSPGTLPGAGIVVDGPARVLVQNTSARGSVSLVVTDPGADVSVGHSQ